jgi:predicted nucleic acid-binding protein
VFDDFANVMEGRVAPILPADVVRAAELAGSLSKSEARDLIHLAVMRRLGLSRIVSSDKRFDAVAGVKRLDPARFEDWRDSVIG